jgi:hypothetical protein
MRPSPVLIAMLALAPISDVAFAEIDCTKIPPGRDRTDCYIMKGRVHGMQSQIAVDKARVKANRAKLPDQDTGALPPPPSRRQAK